MVQQLPLPNGGISQEIAVSGIQFLLTAFFAIQVHRTILVNDSQPIIPNKFKEIGLYLGWALLLSSPSYVMQYSESYIEAFEGSIGTGRYLVLLFVLLIPMSYIYSRTSLLLADRAIGQKTPFYEVWALSKRLGWRLTGAILLPLLVWSLAFAVTIGLVFGLISVVVETDQTLALSIATSLFGYFFIVLSVALISVSYKALTAYGGSNAAAF